jgi:glycine betaine/proline transport system substrate-binding protein
MKASKKLLVVILAVVVGVMAGGCGGSSPENRELNLGVATGWDENQVVANVTKILLEEELGYGEVQLTELELGPVFQGVGSGDLDAFQDMWLPNHQAQLSEVENDVVQLSPWYEGETEFGIGVPTYMTNVNTIPDLNNTDLTQIIGIEPGAVISEKIPDSVIPTYDLNQEYVESSTAGMLSEIDRLFNEGEEFAFTPWRPHWMNQKYSENGERMFKFLEDPEDALEELNDGATISSIVNEIENIDPQDYAGATRTWLEDENNRNSLQPAIDAARDAQES